MDRSLFIPNKCDSLRYPDIQVEDHGSIVLLHARTDTGARWIGEHTDPENRQFFGGALVVEPRYVVDIINGIIESGLMVKL
jgi:hypothetical protein